MKRWQLPIGAALTLASTACITNRYSSMETLELDQLTVPAEPKIAKVGEVNVAYTDAGSGPLVLLVHGLGEHLGYWSENHDVLVKAGLRVLAMDLPGFGRSDKPHSSETQDPVYSMRWQAAVAKGLLDAVAPGQKALVVGHSMGGQVAMQMALGFPDHVAGLALLAPAGIETFTPGEAEFIRKYASTATYRALGEPELRAHYSQNVFTVWSDVAEHHLEERVRIRGAEDFERYLYAVVRSIHGMLDGPVAPRLHKIDVPVVVAFGEKDRLIPNPLLHGGGTDFVVSEAKRLLPGARIEVLDEVGHMLQIERPEVVNRLIIDAARTAGARLSAR